MKFLKIKLLIISVIMFAASSAFAVPYNITVDTQSLKGTAGFLYLQYGGLNAVSSTATVYGYSGGTLAAANSSNVVEGSAVTGTLPGTLVFANTYGVNDYNHGISFGNSLNFNLDLSAPSFGGTPGGNSTFSLGLFQDESGNTSLLGGTLFMANLFNDGNFSFDNIASGVSVAPVPEPGTIALLSAGLFGLCVYGKRRKKE